MRGHPAWLHLPSRMCIFQSGKDIPPLVRISLRTLQYLVAPLLSLAILVVGALHIGRCQGQPLLPVWHVVAGSTGLLTPLFYLLFDEINPSLSRRCPGLSEVIDNAVVFLLPVYVTFELVWLVTGTVWVTGLECGQDKGGQDGGGNVGGCDHSLYVFSLVVVANFWVHVLTLITFMLGLCITRLFPYCAYCSYWNILRKAMDNWTRRARMSLCVGISVPLGLSMVLAGALSVEKCRAGDEDSGPLPENNNGTDRIVEEGPHLGFVNHTFSSNSRNSYLLALSEELRSMHIPIWLMVAGGAVLMVTPVYHVYDKYCKEEGGGPLFKTIANGIVIFYLLCGLAWALVGFLWVFGARSHQTCGADSFTYQFAFGTLIILNVIMDAWICFKICVVLYWAFLSEE